MRLTTLVLASALALAATPAAAAPFSALYVFGDSLSDNGNLSAVAASLGVSVPVAPPYAPGRISNGLVAAEYLASYLGLPALTPFAAGGNNFAVAGAATSLVEVPGQGFSVDNSTALRLPDPALAPPTGLLTWQVAAFTTFVLPGIDPAVAAKALFFIWAGSNDLFINPSEATALQAAANVGTAVDQLYAAGARHFLVPNIPTATLEGAIFNQALALELSGRAGKPGISLTSFDVAARFPQFLHPSFGFTRGLVPCVTGDALAPGINFCQTEDEQDRSILWDSGHPTTAVHQLLAADFLEALPDERVPEPATMVLAAIGLAGAAYRRRRAA